MITDRENKSRNRLHNNTNFPNKHNNIKYTHSVILRHKATEYTNFLNLNTSQRWNTQTMNRNFTLSRFSPVPNSATSLLRRTQHAKTQALSLNSVLLLLCLIPSNSTWHIDELDSPVTHVSSPIIKCHLAFNRRRAPGLLELLTLTLNFTTTVFTYPL